MNTIKHPSVAQYICSRDFLLQLLRLGIASYRNWFLDSILLFVWVRSSATRYSPRSNFHNHDNEDLYIVTKVCG